MRRAVPLTLWLVLAGSAAMADEVTDWNRIMLDAFLVPPAVGAPLAQRPAAIVAASVFDAVNGIERRYTPIHIASAAPPGASKRAAAVQAAYASLVRLFPAQIATFDEKRTQSLSEISSGWGAQNSESIQRGIAWGQAVADAIWQWRSTDGFSSVQPPFLGGMATGQWRPTPPAFAAGLAPQMATMAPWAIKSPSQFRPAGPPPLISSQYAADLNETETMGSIFSASRTADETLYVQFWNSTSPADFWDPVATSLSAGRHFTLLENARLLASLNLALADSVIGCWDAKYYVRLVAPGHRHPAGRYRRQPGNHARPELDAVDRDSPISRISFRALLRERRGGAGPRRFLRGEDRVQHGVGYHAGRDTLFLQFPGCSGRGEECAGLRRHPFSNRLQ